MAPYSPHPCVISHVPRHAQVYFRKEHAEEEDGANEPFRCGKLLSRTASDGLVTVAIDVRARAEEWPASTTLPTPSEVLIELS